MVHKMGFHMLLHTSTFNIALICVPLLINLAMLLLVMDKTSENDKNKFHKLIYIYIYLRRKLVSITLGFGS